MDFDELIDLLAIFIIIILSFIACNYFIYENEKDLIIWKDNKNIVTYNECRYFNGIYYCIKEVK